MDYFKEFDMAIQAYRFAVENAFLLIETMFISPFA